MDYIFNCVVFFQLWRGLLILMMRYLHTPLHLLSHLPWPQVQSSTKQMMWGIQGTRCLLLIAPGLVSAAVLPRALFWEAGWSPACPSTEGQWESPTSTPTLVSTELLLSRTNSTLMVSIHLQAQGVTMTVSIALLPVWSTRPHQKCAPTPALPRVLLGLGNTRHNAWVAQPWRSSPPMGTSSIRSLRALWLFQLNPWVLVMAPCLLWISRWQKLQEWDEWLRLYQDSPMLAHSGTQVLITSRTAVPSQETPLSTTSLLNLKNQCVSTNSLLTLTTWSSSLRQNPHQCLNHHQDSTRYPTAPLCRLVPQHPSAAWTAPT